MAESLNKTITPNPPFSLDLLSYRHDVRISHPNGQAHIFDPIRKKHVVLTPEEFVRQLCVRFLLDTLKVGQGRIAIERQIPNYQENRFDIAVLTPNGQSSLLIECKSFKVALSRDTTMQIAKYNQTLQATTLLITNGMEALAWQNTLPLSWLQKDAFLAGVY